jgi:hypothetical protein
MLTRGFSEELGRPDASTCEQAEGSDRMNKLQALEAGERPPAKRRLEAQERHEDNKRRHVVRGHDREG